MTFLFAHSKSFVPVLFLPQRLRTLTHLRISPPAPPRRTLTPPRTQQILRFIDPCQLRVVLLREEEVQAG
jgi:hypothetical protein